MDPSTWPIDTGRNDALRPVHVPATRLAAGVALAGLLGLTACSNQPNDLRDYGEDEAESTSATPPPPQRPQASAKRQGRAVERLRPRVRAALLTERDVAAEGVRPDPGAEAEEDPRDCLAGSTPRPVVEQDTSWLYPTGSRLRHRVAGFPGDGAARLAREARACGPRQLDVSFVPDVDAASGWCAPTPPASCAVLLANDQRLSAVTVSGTTEQRAAEAVLRLAPIAADALRGAEQ
ncbi:MAG: hypothetical protein GEU98_09585 [Pseudonocardiaceae bacterium]|nr:hypothetical protein [Pseudonocardiaceae bacterium]